MIEIQPLSLVRVCAILALLSTTALTQAPTGAAAPTASQPSGLIFVENAGQFADGVRFQVRGGGLTLWLAEDAIWLTVLDQGAAESATRPAGSGDTRAGSPPPPGNSVNIKLSFPGANPHPRLEPFNRLEMHISFFIGSDSARWRADVPVWGGVRTLALYPGIDLELTGEGGGLVPRLVARPGADLGAVRLRVEGADLVEVEGDTLRLSTAAGEVTWPLLRAEGSSAQAAVQPRGPGVFEVTAPFAVEDQLWAGEPAADDNPNALLYGTFLGGSSSDWGEGIAVDGSGAAYVTGMTNSFTFPTTPGVWDTDYNAGVDAFVAKLNASGSALDFATFLGGGSWDQGYGIVVDGSGAAYVTGYTESANFPTTPDAFDTSFIGEEYTDAFVVKLSADGSALAYATFLGGDGYDEVNGIAVDESGAAYITGYTQASTFPTIPGDAFVVKLNAGGTALDYTAVLGGSDRDWADGIAVDKSGAAYVTGGTWSTDFPSTPGAFDPSHNGGIDAFVTKLNAAGSALDYSTFLGGSGGDLASSIALDESGAAYITGQAGSSDFPTTPGAFDTSHNQDDVFVAKLNPDGSALDYATFLGGSSSDERGYGIAVDESGAAHVTGSTGSSDFPTTLETFDGTFNGMEDAFVIKLNAAGSALKYATFLGGAGQDWAYGIALDSRGVVYVTGYTLSPNFPTTLGAFDTTLDGGAQDAFAARLTTSYSIFGRVTDALDHGIPGVIIRAGVGGSVGTDASGEYDLTNVITGTYTLTPTSVCYSFDPMTRIVTVPPDALGQDFVGEAVECFRGYLPLVVRNR
jgi:hypothetical protein